MRYLLVVALLVTALVPAAALAQDEEPRCSDATLGTYVMALEAYVEHVRKLHDEGEEFISYIAGLRPVLDDIVSECGDEPELAWEGTNDRVIGPVSIPAGTYRATVSTDSWFVNAELDVQSGSCGDRFLPFMLMLASDGDEALFESEGCTTLIGVEAAGDWRIELNPMSGTS